MILYFVKFVVGVIGSLQSGYMMISVELIFMFIMKKSFIDVCCRGHFQIVQWLYSLDREIDIHKDNDKLFRLVCKNGNFEIAKWLYKNFGGVNIHANNDEAFREVCSHGRFEDLHGLSLRLRGIPFY